jgi:hypothetical protein
VAISQQGLDLVRDQITISVPWSFLEPPRRLRADGAADFTYRQSAQVGIVRIPFRLEPDQAIAVLSSPFAPRWATPEGLITGIVPPAADSAILPTAPDSTRRDATSALPRLKRTWYIPGLDRSYHRQIIPTLALAILVLGLQLGYIFRSPGMTLAYILPALAAYYPAKSLAARVDSRAVSLFLAFGIVLLAPVVAIGELQFLGVGAWVPPAGFVYLPLFTGTFGFGLWSMISIMRRKPELLSR